MVDKSTGRVAAMFAQISPRYDLLNHLLSLSVDRWWRRRTVRTAAPDGPAPILDVCSGTGDLAITYGRRGGSPCPIVATDICHKMLVLAGAKFRRAGLADRVRTVVADTQRLPFDNDLFQIVCVAFGLRNLADTDAGLAEMARVTRPGGRVAILEFSKPTNPLFRFIYYAYFRIVLPIVGQMIARNTYGAYRYLPDSVMEFPDGQALVDRMRLAGLSDVQAHRLTFGIATLYVGSKPDRPA